MNIFFLKKCSHNIIVH